MPKSAQSREGTRFDIPAGRRNRNHLKGKVFRIGHLRFRLRTRLLTAVAAIEGPPCALGLPRERLVRGWPLCRRSWPKAEHPGAAVKFRP